MKHSTISPHTQAIRASRLAALVLLQDMFIKANLALAVAPAALGKELQPVDADDPDLLIELEAMQKLIDRITPLQKDFADELDALVKQGSRPYDV